VCCSERVKISEFGWIESFVENIVKHTKADAGMTLWTRLMRAPLPGRAQLLRCKYACTASSSTLSGHPAVCRAPTGHPATCRDPSGQWPPGHMSRPHWPPATCHVPTGHPATCHDPTGHPATYNAPTGDPASCHAPTGQPATFHGNQQIRSFTFAGVS
jgi:hypothetical protein